MKKIIILSLILIFGAQQLALAKREDLRDSEIKESSVLLSVLTGVMSAASAQASGSAWTMFAYNYLVPKASQMIIKQLDIENEALAIVLNTVISAGLKGGFDAALENTAQGMVKGSTKSIWQRVKGRLGLGAKPSADPFGEMMRKEVAGVYQKTLKEILGISAKTAIKAGGFAAGREAMYSALKKHNSEEVAQFLAKGAGVLSGELVGRVIKDPTKNFLRKMIVYVGASGVETLVASAGGREFGIVLGAGTNRLLSQMTLTKEEKSAMLRKIQTDKVIVQAEKEKELGKLANAKDEQERKEIQTRINIWEAIGKGVENQEKELKRGPIGSFFEGVKFGGISAGLQYVSLKTDTPVHGAMFNLAGTSLAKAALVKKKYVFGIDDETPLEKLETVDIDRLAQANKGAHFYLSMLGDSVTRAKADWMSMGQAEPVIRNDSGFPVFDLKITQPASDIFFISRYADYIRGIQTHKGRFYPVLSMLEQFITSAHYQSVKNVYDILPSFSEMSRGRFSLGERLQAPYIFTRMNGPSPSQMRDKASQVILEAEKVDEELKTRIGKGMNEVANALSFKDTHQTWKQILKDLKEKREATSEVVRLPDTVIGDSLPDGEKKLVQALDDYFNLYPPQAVKQGDYLPGVARWGILERPIYSKADLAKDKALYGPEFATDSGLYKQVEDRYRKKLENAMSPAAEELSRQKAVEATEITREEDTFISPKLRKKAMREFYNEELARQKEKMRSEIWGIIKRQEPVSSITWRDLSSREPIHYDIWKEKSEKPEKIEQKRETIKIENVQSY